MLLKQRFWICWTHVRRFAPLAVVQVIGVGLSRTGTFSTRIALTTLLGGKCYHGYVASLDGEPEFWKKAADGLMTDEDWINGLEGRGYTAGVGEPINLFYPEILKVSFC